MTSRIARAAVVALSFAALATSSCKREQGGKAAPSPAVTSDAAVDFDPGEPRGTMALPGAQPFVVSLESKLVNALAAKGPSYVARTKHKDKAGKPLFSNRLLFESSPYLLQHAHNPVNWYPWGNEAFATARRRKVPVLLSIGYSTCHWCHVMEEESFENVEIASYLNANYVVIKVDREERPDLDSIYMAAVQMIAGRGGWPMTVWLTHDRQPFYGGTYFPPKTGVRGARTGFLELLTKLKKAYDEDGVRVVDGAKELARRIRESSATGFAGSVDGPGYLHRAMYVYKSRHDSEWGGMRSNSTKFPSSFPVRLLFRYYRRTGDTTYRDIAAFTLEKMASGGMYDHIGGGFHRYSTDAKWLVPHFEKMLYDNALLVPAYLDGYQATGRKDFARVARDILRYVRREMTAPSGGFYSATDADSLDAKGHRVEGAFFTWKPAEIRAALGKLPKVGGKSVAEIVNAYYQVTQRGNFVHEGVSRSILWTPKPAAEIAKKLGITVAQLHQAIAAAREPLYQVRAKRPPPIRDEKILAAWNGKMISAFARAHIVLGANQDGGPSYAAQGAKAAELILTKMRKKGRLLRAFKAGRAYLPGYLPDYAFMIQGLIDLFEATSDPRWLTEAIALDKVVADHFEDKVKGGFFFVADDHEKLLARQKPAYDGARPSGNSIMAMNLLRLSELTTNYAYRERADLTFGAFSDNLTRSATSLAQMLLAIDFATDTAKQIVIVAPNNRAEAKPFMRALAGQFVPNHVLAVVAQGAQLGQVGKYVPLVKDKTATRGQVTAYVCERQRCELPTRDPAQFIKQISKIAPLPK